MPKIPHIKKVLVIGSGPVIIGQAAEFDYAGTQACLALKEEGISVILINNNPATIMTDEKVADQVYLEPLTVASITKIITQERPDGLLPTLGGQTGLNLAVELSKAGILEKYNVELLGTPLETIQKGEDRELFKALMEEMNEPIAESISTTSVDKAILFAKEVGYPVIIRPAYTLGGAGGGIANNETELIEIALKGINNSPINQILVEYCLKGWKEIEYEVVRDANDTCIIVCNMENIDPVGIHTGDSIVVAPSQTLNDYQYQFLRNVSYKIIRKLGVIGGCNIQFALHPKTNEYFIIEVNPRVSRSSALASKATGYPIARIAAKLALGYRLDELANPIAGNTVASLEPAIDYVALKIPRWPFEKFNGVKRQLGTQMMATGEVMALARNFPAAIQKAICSLEIYAQELFLAHLQELSNPELEKLIANATDERLFAIAEGFRRGYSVKKLHQLSTITKFFLYQIAAVIQLENDIKQKDWESLSAEELKKLKYFGFSNEAIERLFNQNIKSIEDRITQLELKACYKMVDTCAGEFKAHTPYFYSTWNEFNEVKPLSFDRKMVVLGSGPIRIGQGIEFDYCSVQAALSLKEQNIGSIVINNNPETVSTDIHVADHLYFEPLSVENVCQIAQQENADGVLVQFGGQTAINLASELRKKGIKIMGTSVESLEATENRDLFYQLLENLNIPHIPGRTVTSIHEIQTTATEIGYPILIRPSFVIGGSGMIKIENNMELQKYIDNLSTNLLNEKIFPLLIDRFMDGLEVEIDAVCDGEDILIPGIFEHIEPAGIHSGDSMAIFPAPNLTEKQKEMIYLISKKISKALQVKGLMNIQFVIPENNDRIYVLEVNPRASRTVPIVSKVTGVPMVNLATKVQMGQMLSELDRELGLHQPIPYFVVKAPVFSTNKLIHADPILGPEMKSTGEVIGIGVTIQEALYKAFHWKDYQEKGLSIYLTLMERELPKMDAILNELKHLQTSIYTDQKTANLLMEKNFTVNHILTPNEALSQCLQDKFHLVYTGSQANYRQLREATLNTNTRLFTVFETFQTYIQSLSSSEFNPLPIGYYQQMKSLFSKRKEISIK